ncbi:phage late control D family protein [Geodermatophilus sp. SYSU D00766]
MRLAQLEQDHTHQRFYVPAFTVKVGGEDVLRDLYLAVTSVSVDLKEKTAGRFSFTVAGAFDWDAREFLATRHEERVDLLELFAFGRTVEVALGYGDPRDLRPMLTGPVTELSTDFSAGSSPELSVSGSDGLYPLTVGKNTRHWENKPDSVAVQDVAQAAGLSTDVRPTSPSKERIDQNNEADLVFVTKLAERNGATFYERDGSLYFGPRRNDTTDVAELTWGAGLLSFSPEANLARQIAEVRVHSRSEATGKPIVGRARRGEESGRDTRAKSGGERIDTTLAPNPVLNIRAAVRTQEEADARAKAVLEERAQDFVTGGGECVGLPGVLPDTNVTVNGLGRAFSKTYYVSEATHTIDGGGYHTTFKVQETTV